MINTIKKLTKEFIRFLRWDKFLTLIQQPNRWEVYEWLKSKGKRKCGEQWKGHTYRLPGEKIPLTTVRRAGSTEKVREIM